MKVMKVMKVQHILTITMFAVVSALLSPLVSADPIENDPAGREKISWFGQLEDGDHVLIDNPYGDVRLRFGGYHGGLEVVAVTQNLRKDGAYLKVNPAEVGDGAEIRVEWKMKPGLDLPIPLEGDKSRADLAVMVPLGVTIEVRGGDGLVEMHGTRCDADIHAESGLVLIRKHQGRVNATSNGGTIEAMLLKGVTTDPQSFETRTGAIKIWVPPDAGHYAVVETSGTITTDFSIDIKHLTGQEPDKSGSATLGDGGPGISIKSLRGDVSLRRLVEVHSGATKP